MCADDQMPALYHQWLSELQTASRYLFAAMR
jgi:hypothetical protein